MKHKIGMIILFFIVFVIFSMTQVKATTLDEILANGQDNMGLGVYIHGTQTMSARRDLYCIQHWVPVPIDENGPRNPNYHVLTRFTIDGNKLTGWGYKNGWFRTSSISTSSGAIAYILSANHGYEKGYGIELGTGDGQTTTQRVLYRISNEWFGNTVTRDFGFNWYCDANNAFTDGGCTTPGVPHVPPRDSERNLYNDSYKYADNVGTMTIEKAQSTSSTKPSGSGYAQGITDKTDYNRVTSVLYNAADGTPWIRIGPFNWEYEGDLSKVTVKTNKGTYSYTTRQKPDKLWTSQFTGNVENWWDPANLNSGWDTYLSILANDGDTRIEAIELEGAVDKGTIYKTDIWVLEPNAGAGQQKLVLVKPSSGSGRMNLWYRKQVNTIQVPVTRNLQILKVDQENQSIPISGVGFILRNTDANKYVKVENGVTKYVADRNQATEFVTNGSGNITVNNLVVGNYEAYEVSSSNPLYPATSLTRAISLNGDSATIQVKITNLRKSGNLEIHKVDQDNHNIKLPNVKFTLRATSGSMNGKYVSVNSSGKAVYNNSQVTVQTNGSGDLYINDLVTGNYELREVENPNQGYLVDYSGSIQVNRGQTTTRTVENGFSHGKLEINKYDKDIPSIKLEGVEFRLKQTQGHMAGKYVGVDSSGNATYSSNPVTMKTNSLGQIKIDKLWVGSYELEETNNPNYGYLVNTQKIYLTINKRQTTVQQVPNEYQLGSLDILKVDKDLTNLGLPNVEFTLRKKDGHMAGKYVSVDSNGNAAYSNNVVTIKTNVEGKIHIDRLWIGKYELIEVNNPNYGYLVDSTPVEVTIRKRETTSITRYNEYLLGAFDLLKVDLDNHDIVLKDVEFTLRQTEGHMKGKYVYVDSNGNAAYSDNKVTIKTNAEGRIHIEKLWVGTYELIETHIPDEAYVPITPKQTITIRKRETTSVVVENKLKYIKLKGYVWEDVQSTKMSTRNDLYKDADYDDQDILVSGIKVRLKEGNRVLQEKVTDQNGAYVFEKVDVDELSKYYIEFEYDGLIYQDVKLHTNDDNGSKAIEGSLRDTFNNQFASVEGGNSRDTAEVKDANGNTVYEVKYNLDEQNHSASIRYPSECIITADTNRSGYEIPYEKGHGIHEVENINLGVYRRTQADLAISQDLENVKMEIAGYAHIYRYDQRADHATDNDSTDYADMRWNVGVRYRSPFSDLTYTRPIYEADAKHYEEDPSQPLKVSLTYKLAIRNEETIVSQVNSLVDYFDSRYTIRAVGTGVDNSTGNLTGILQQNVDWYIDDSYSSNRHTKLVINNANILVNASVSNTNEAEKDKTKKYIYIQFEVSNENIVEMLNVAKALNNDLNAIEDAGNLMENCAEITSYTSYTDMNKTKLYAAVDKDSVPENAEPEDTATYEDDTDSAPPIAITLANAREVKGSVFEDSADENLLETDNIRQGNTTFDEGENPVGGVVAELIDAETGETARVYDEQNNEWIDATCDSTTNSQGEYTISGYIPGRYKIKYTWGDGTFKIVDGEEIPYENVVEDYKATNLDQATHEAEENNDKFFKDANESDVKRSHALDDYTLRQEIDEQLNPDDGYNYSTEVTTRYMTSTTPTMEFELEYADEGSTADEIVTSITLDRLENRVAFTVNNLDFGIIRRPVQSVNFVKSLRKIKIVLADGRTLIDATIDENGNLSGSTNYLSYVKPVKENGITIENGFLKAELDSEIIQGATVEMEYNLRTENTSNADYMSQGFYQYGKGYYDNRQNGETEKENDIVTITPSKIVDYLDAKTVYRETDPLNEQYQWEQVRSVQDLKDLGLVDESVTDAIESGEFEQELANGETQVFDIDENKIYTTSYLAAQGVKLRPIRKVNNEERPAEGGDVMMAVEKVLNSAEDANFTNQAELIVLNKPGGSKPTSTPGNYVPTKHQQEVDDSTSEELIVTPSTGENRDYTIAIILVVAFMILATGIVLIIFKVLKRRE